MHATATFIVFLKYTDLWNIAYSWLRCLNAPLSVTGSGVVAEHMKKEQECRKFRTTDVEVANRSQKSYNFMYLQTEVSRGCIYVWLTVTVKWFCPTEY
jgi:hypothetical protein